jgi:transcriptional regulator with XRE-family HTH domain
MGAESFRHRLHELLHQRGWTVPTLAKVAGYHRGYLWELANGRNRKRPSADLVADLDQALGADGTLILAWEGGDDVVDRREVLRDLSVLALAAPMAGVESIRQGLHAALRPAAGATHQWDEIVAEYAQTFYLSAPHELLRDLMADIVLLSRQLPDAAERGRPPLCRAAGQLAAITAMTWAGLGQHRQAHRWWGTARDAADASRDPATRVWVRGWQVANGLYERRPATAIFDSASEAVAIAGTRADAGAAGLFAGLAQTQAVARHPEALSTLGRVADLTGRVSAAEAADHDSMFGWPEVRLRHTESYVYTTLGETARAYQAQDAALALYGPDLARECAAMQLHRARCMITDGDVSGGAAYAHQVLDQLPDEHHTELVYAVARDALVAVPDSDANLTPVSGLRERLTLPPGRA